MTPAVPVRNGYLSVDVVFLRPCFFASVSANFATTAALDSPRARTSRSIASRRWTGSETPRSTRPDAARSALVRLRGTNHRSLLRVFLASKTDRECLVFANLADLAVGGEK